MRHRSLGRVLRSALAADIALAVAVLVVGVALLAHHATMRPDASTQQPGVVVEDGHAVASTGHTEAAEPVEPHSQAKNDEACDTPATTCLTAKTGIGVAVPAPNAIADILIPPPMQAPTALASTSLPHLTPDLAQLSVLQI